jgi:hypothetical protein
VKQRCKTVSSSRELTLSKYDSGRHHFCECSRGSPSFAESLGPLTEMISEIYAQGAKLGGKVAVTMTAVKQEPANEA